MALGFNIEVAYQNKFTSATVSAVNINFSSKCKQKNICIGWNPKKSFNQFQSLLCQYIVYYNPNSVDLQTACGQIPAEVSVYQKEFHYRIKMANIMLILLYTHNE